MVASIKPSAHLAEVRYEIRGALNRRARDMEASGLDIIKLNIGNPGRYGFEAPAHLREAVASHLHQSDAYGHEQGLELAREAIAEQQRARGARGVDGRCGRRWGVAQPHGERDAASDLPTTRLDPDESARGLRGAKRSRGCDARDRECFRAAAGSATARACEPSASTSEARRSAWRCPRSHRRS